MKDKPRQIAKVEWIEGEIGRYRVQSLSRPSGAYVVDLLARDGIGQCDCEDWKFTCYANIMKNAENGPLAEYGYPGSPNPNRMQCKHIFLAKRKFCNDALKQMAKEIKDAGS